MCGCIDEASVEIVIVCGAGAGLPELTTVARPRASAPLAATPAVSCASRLR